LKAWDPKDSPRRPSLSVGRGLSPGENSRRWGIGRRAVVSQKKEEASNKKALRGGPRASPSEKIRTVANRRKGGQPRGGGRGGGSEDQFLPRKKVVSNGRASPLTCEASCRFSSDGTLQEGIWLQRRRRKKYSEEAFLWSLSTPEKSRGAAQGGGGAARSKHVAGNGVQDRREIAAFGEKSRR